MRSGARRLIGTATITTWEASAQVMEDAVRELARSEDLRVALVPYGYGEGFEAGSKAETERIRYRAAIESMAAKHHFLWVDTIPEMREFREQKSTEQSDGVHGTSGAHVVMGEAVAARLVTELSLGKTPTDAQKI